MRKRGRWLAVHGKKRGRCVCESQGENRGGADLREEDLGGADLREEDLITNLSQKNLGNKFKTSL